MKKIIPLRQQEILTISGGASVTSHTRTPEEKRSDNLYLVIGTIQVLATIWFIASAATQKSLKLRRRRRLQTPQNTIYYGGDNTTPETKIEEPIPIVKLEKY